MKDLADIQKMRYDRGCVVYTPPNRALIPTGRFIDVVKMIKHAAGEEA